MRYNNNIIIYICTNWSEVHIGGNIFNRLCTKFNLFCLKPPVKNSDFTTEYVKCISFLIYKGEITLGKIITCIKRLNVNYIYFVLNHETLCTYIYMHTSILQNINIKYTGNCFSLLHSSSFFCVRVCMTIACMKLDLVKVKSSLFNEMQA